MFKKISFKVKGINNNKLMRLNKSLSMCVKSLPSFTEMNDSVVNLIHLDKGRAKNLTCNYSYQRNKIVWFKVKCLQKFTHYLIEF